MEKNRDQTRAARTYAVLIAETFKQLTRKRLEPLLGGRCEPFNVNDNELTTRILFFDSLLVLLLIRILNFSSSLNETVSSDASTR